MTNAVLYCDFDDDPEQQKVTMRDPGAVVGNGTAATAAAAAAGVLGVHGGNTRSRLKPRHGKEEEEAEEDLWDMLEAEVPSSTRAAKKARTEF